MTHSYPTPEALMEQLAEGFSSPLAISPDVTVQMYERQYGSRYPDIDIATVMALDTPVTLTLDGRPICHPLVSEYTEGQEAELIHSAAELQRDISAARAAAEQGREYLPLAVQNDMQSHNIEQLSSDAITKLLLQEDLSPRWRTAAIQVLWNRIKTNITAAQPYPDGAIRSFPLPTHQPQPLLFQVVSEEQHRYQWRINDFNRQLDSGGFNSSNLGEVKTAFQQWVNPQTRPGAS